MIDRTTLGIALLGPALGIGCAQQASSEDDTAQGEDAIGLRKGSVDNAAIVESTTMMLAGVPTDSHLDPYNQEDPFAIRAASYAPTFAHRLAEFDAYDGKKDWQEPKAAAWAARMASANYLVLDTSKPCGDFGSPHTYLEIERARMTGKENATCGGRMPNEDALDVTVNFLVRGPAASVDDADAIHDGVEEATKKSADTFPYLAELNGL